MTQDAPAFRERLTFDAAAGAIFDQTRRYMLLRPDALMGVFRHLPEPQRTQALDALEQSIFEQGSDSARAYAKISGADPEGLMRIIAATAPHLGWGLWTFDLAPGRLTLEVRNSPFAAGHGPSPTPVCHAIKGMVRAVAEPIFGARARVAELTCTATGAQTCCFEALPEK